MSQITTKQMTNCVKDRKDDEMQDIRLVGNDGEYLNLETQSGDKFRLVLDDSLRSAVKRDSSVQLDSVNISPRAIQDAVRAGATAEEVSARHSVPLDYVEKFALTVVDEIGHIIASSQAVRVSIEADRFSEATHLEFAEVVANRVNLLGGSNLRWSAVKHEATPWHVTVAFETQAGNQSAVWSFDPRKLILSPENEIAIKFSSGDHSPTAPTAKLRTIEALPDQTQVIELDIKAFNEPTTLSSVSSIEQLTKSSAEAAIASAAETVVEEEVAEPELEALSATADLLEALRKKRAAVAKVEPPLTPAPSETPAAAAPVELKPEPIVVEPPASAAKKGRPSMPSWDEIVFGTKTED
jgi:hypothetical protein